MKKIMTSLLLLSLFANTSVMAQQDKSKRPSPAMATETTLADGATIKINYSAPSVKGRTIGKDLEPMEGKVWRTGANEATTFEVSKDVKVEGQALPAGKYSLFTIINGDEWTIIFNKTASQWGAFKYTMADDALRVKVKSSKAAAFTEQFKIDADKDGNVTLLWGDVKVVFTVN